MPRKVSAHQLHTGAHLSLPSEALGTARRMADLEDDPEGKLDQRYVVPPFSILNSHSGPWTERKRMYMSLGIQSELGRGETNNPGSPGDTRPGREGGEYKGGNAWNKNTKVPGSSRPYNGLDLAQDPDLMRHGRKGLYSGSMSSAFNADGGGTSDPASLARRYGKGRKANAETFDIGSTAEFHRQYDQPRGRKANAIPGGSKFPAPKMGADGHTERQEGSGTSIFDPVLCELMYRWFCPPSGVVLDPFAGGSVRGIVAALWGRGYVGIDLRAEQVAANQAQKHIAPVGSRLRWIPGDSEVILPDLHGFYDFLFTCPPYFNLELYSYDKADLSNAEDYPEFLYHYQQIIALGGQLLSDDRFAAIVVGNFRDKEGNLIDFVGDTIRACEAAGLRYYNEFILATAIGSLALRTRNQFRASRKVGKTHQQVLVFVKGDPRRAAKAAREG